MIVAGIATALTLGFSTSAVLIHHHAAAGSKPDPLPPTPEQSILTDVRHHVAAKLQDPANATAPQTELVGEVQTIRTSTHAAAPNTPPCIDKVRPVPGIGRACHVKDGYWKMQLSGGRESFTHGFDPTPEAAAQTALATSMFALAGGDGAGRAAANQLVSLDASNGMDATLPDGTVGDIDCAEPGELGHQIIYAVPSDLPDRTGPALFAQIRQKVYDASAFMDHEAQSVDPTRHLRIKFRCTAGVPDIKTLHLTTDSGTVDFDGDLDQIYADADQLALGVYPGSPFAQTSPLLFADKSGGGEAGIAETYRGNGASGNDPDNLSNTGALAAEIYLDGADWSAYATLHELAHNMGAVQDDSPNSTTKGHCRDGQDVMCYDDFGRPQLDPAPCSDRMHFDCNHDDYFNPLPTVGSYLATHRNLGVRNNAHVTIINPGDVSPPVIPVITRPSVTGQHVNSVIVDATDDIAVRKVTIDVDGQKFTDYLPPFAFTRDPYHIRPDLPNGMHTITATATDTSGNTTTSAPITAFIDTIDPPFPAEQRPGHIMGKGDGFYMRTTNNRTELAMHWSTVVDDSDVSYAWCFASIEYCAYHPERYSSTGFTLNDAGDGFNIDLTTPQFPGGVPLVEDNGVTKYQLCVKTSDSAGNEFTSGAQCSLPTAIDDLASDAPTDVKDGMVDGADVADAAQLAVNFGPSTQHGRAPSAGYDICFATSRDCSTGVGATLHVTNGGHYNVDSSALTDGQTYYACVTNSDTAGNVSPQACSDGQKLDLLAPTAPTAVHDGTGADQAWSTNSVAVFANWIIGSDSSSGVKEYQWCVTETQGVCGSNASGQQAGSYGVSFNGALASGVRSLPLVQGTTYYVCVQAVDNVGRMSGLACSNGAKVDSDAPSRPTAVRDGAVAGVDATWQTSGTSAAANWDASSDDVSGIAKYEYCFSAVPTTCDVGFLTPWISAGPAGLTGSATGLNVLSGSRVFACVRVTDVAGNSSYPQCSNAARVDSDMPVAAVLRAPINNEVVANAPLLTWTVGTDPTSGVDHQVFMIDGSEVATIGASVDSRTAPSLADGAHTWSIGTVDTAGNRTNTAAETFVVDHTAPNPPALTAPANGAVTTDTTPTLTWNTASSNGPSAIDHYQLSSTALASSPVQLAAGDTSYTIPSALADGTYSWTVYAYDTLGRASAVPASRTFLVDTTAPVPVQIDSTFNGWQPSGSVDVWWSGGYDLGSGFDHYAVSVDGGAEAASPYASTHLNLVGGGVHTVQVTAYDKAGLSSSATTEIKVDTTAPTLALDAPADTATVTTSHPQFTWTGSDTQSGSGPGGYITYTLYVDAQQFTQTSYGDQFFTMPGSLADGPHTWHMDATDSVGNTVSSPTQAFTVDTSAGAGANATVTPTLTFPTSGAAVRSIQPTLTWVDPSGRDTSYDVYVDGAAVATGVTGTQYAVASALSQGAHTWRVTAHGPTGLMHASTITFQVDSMVDAAASITSPTNGAVLDNGTPTVAFTAATDHGLGLEHYELRVDGQLAAMAPASASSIAPSAPLGDGAHVLQVVAFDVAGNSVASASVNVTVQVPPAPTPPKDPTPTTTVDVCPNLVGDQASIPAGFISNALGQCVTPPVVPAPPKVTFVGGVKADKLIGNALANIINGMAGNDTLDGGAGNDTVHGGDGNDKVVGGTGKDKIYGDKGTDILDGNDHKPGDLIDGGAGKDTCTYNKGDIVKNCEKKVLKK